jgi:hypothetical protein
MKTKTLSFSMMAALSHMLDVEERTAQMNLPGSCSNVEIGFHVKSNTATALEKRGLALRVCCPLTTMHIELCLTDEGREVARSHPYIGCAIEKERAKATHAPEAHQETPADPSTRGFVYAPKAPKESEAPQATRKKTYRIETYNMHRNPPTESLTVQGYAPALIIAKTLQSTHQFSVLLRHVDAKGRVGHAIRFRS